MDKYDRALRQIRIARALANPAFEVLEELDPLYAYEVLTDEIDGLIMLRDGVQDRSSGGGPRPPARARGRRAL